MNKRIEKLADEARIKFSAHWAHEGVDTAVITRRDLKEFAELILNRVLEMVEAHESIFDKPDERALIKHIARSIKIDFDIK
jgi:hypothetical protein